MSRLLSAGAASAWRVGCNRISRAGLVAVSSRVCSLSCSSIIYTSSRGTASGHPINAAAAAPVAARSSGWACDVCGVATDDGSRLSDENWEFCEGLGRRFCGSCREAREAPPCDDPSCQADVCSNARDEAAEDASATPTLSMLRVLVDWPAGRMRLTVDVPAASPPTVADLAAAVAKALGLQAGQRVQLRWLMRGLGAAAVPRPLDPALPLSDAGVSHGSAVEAEVVAAPPPASALPSVSSPRKGNSVESQSGRPAGAGTLPLTELPLAPRAAASPAPAAVSPAAAAAPPAPAAASPAPPTLNSAVASNEPAAASPAAAKNAASPAPAAAAAAGTHARRTAVLAATATAAAFRPAAPRLPPVDAASPPIVVFCVLPPHGRIIGVSVSPGAYVASLIAALIEAAQLALPPQQIDLRLRTAPAPATAGAGGDGGSSSSSSSLGAPLDVRLRLADAGVGDGAEVFVHVLPSHHQMEGNGSGATGPGVADPSAVPLVPRQSPHWQEAPPPSERAELGAGNLALPAPTEGSAGPPASGAGLRSRVASLLPARQEVTHPVVVESDPCTRSSSREATAGPKVTPPLDQAIAITTAAALAVQPRGKSGKGSSKAAQAPPRQGPEKPTAPSSTAPPASAPPTSAPPASVLLANDRQAVPDAAPRPAEPALPPPPPCPAASTPPPSPSVAVARPSPSDAPPFVAEGPFLIDAVVHSRCAAWAAAAAPPALLVLGPPLSGRATLVRVVLPTLLLRARQQQQQRVRGAAGAAGGGEPQQPQQHPAVLHVDCSRVFGDEAAAAVTGARREEVFARTLLGAAQGVARARGFASARKPEKRLPRGSSLTAVAPHLAALAREAAAAAAAAAGAAEGSGSGGGLVVVISNLQDIFIDPAAQDAPFVAGLLGALAAVQAAGGRVVLTSSLGALPLLGALSSHAAPALLPAAARAVWADAEVLCLGETPPTPAAVLTGARGACDWFLARSPALAARLSPERILAFLAAPRLLFTPTRGLLAPRPALLAELYGRLAKIPAAAAAPGANDREFRAAVNAALFYVVGAMSSGPQQEAAAALERLSAGHRAVAWALAAGRHTRASLLAALQRELGDDAAAAAAAAAWWQAFCEPAKEGQEAVPLRPLAPYASALSLLLDEDGGLLLRCVRMPGGAAGGGGGRVAWRYGPALSEAFAAFEERWADAGEFEGVSPNRVAAVSAAVFASLASDGVALVGPGKKRAPATLDEFRSSSGGGLHFYGVVSSQATMERLTRLQGEACGGKQQQQQQPGGGGSGSGGRVASLTAQKAFVREAGVRLLLDLQALGSSSSDGGGVRVLLPPLVGYREGLTPPAVRRALRAATLALG